MNRQIGVGDSKNVIVFDPLLTGHVIRRMRLVYQMNPCNGGRRRAVDRVDGQYDKLAGLPWVCGSPWVWVWGGYGDDLPSHRPMGILWGFLINLK